MKLYVVSESHLQLEKHVYESILGSVETLKATHPGVAASLYSLAVDGLERVAASEENQSPETVVGPGKCCGSSCVCLA
jgi:hypothetical protein